MYHPIGNLYKSPQTQQELTTPTHLQQVLTSAEKTQWLVDRQNGVASPYCSMPGQITPPR